MENKMQNLVNHEGVPRNIKESTPKLGQGWKDFDKFHEDRIF